MAQVVPKTYKFSSKSVKHVASYEPVAAVLNYVLAFSFVKFFYDQFFSVLDFTEQKVVPPFVFDYYKVADEKFDTLVLGNFDSTVKTVQSKIPTKLPTLPELNPVTLANSGIKYANDDVLKPANNYAYETYNKYLPASITENKTAFKIEQLSGKSQIYVSYDIVVEFLNRLSTLFYSKTNEISGELISTYNKEVETIGDKSTGIQKNVVASYNTGRKAFKGFNEGYIQPLRTQTQDYVNEVAASTKNRTNAILSDVRQGVESTTNVVKAKEEEIVTKLSGAANGSVPVVSASA